MKHHNVYAAILFSVFVLTQFTIASICFAAHCSETIAHRILRLESHIAQKPLDLRVLDTLISNAYCSIPIPSANNAVSASNSLRAIARLLTASSFTQYDHVASFTDSLSPRLTNGHDVVYPIDCYTISLLYVAIGESLGMPIRYVSAPSKTHASVRWYLSSNDFVSWEALKGGTIDEYYFPSYTSETGSVLILPSQFISLDKDETVADALIQAGIGCRKTDAALKYFDEAINTCTNYGLCYRARGLYYRDRGEYDKVVADFHRWQTLDKDNEPIECYLRGDAFFTYGDYGAAIADLSTAIDRKCGLISAFFSRGCAYLFLGQYSNAVGDLSHYMSGVYDDYRPYSYRAYAFFMMGDIDKSYDDYDKAIKLGDSNAETAESRLRVMLYRREYRRILDETERTTLSTGDVHAARVFLIRSSANIGISNVVAAIEDLRHAMVCASNDMEAMNNLAWIYVSEPAVRDGCQALYLASKAIAISRRPECLTTLACAYAETGDYSNAVKCISEAYAITNDPEYIEYRTAFLNGTKYIEYVHNKRRGAVSGKNGIELNGESRP